jgi:hypothetical protein
MYNYRICVIFNNSKHFVFYTSFIQVFIGLCPAACHFQRPWRSVPVPALVLLPVQWRPQIDPLAAKPQYVRLRLIIYLTAHVPSFV